MSVKPYKSYSAKELKRYSIILKILAIPLFIMSFMLLFVSLLFGFLFCAFSVLLWCMSNKYKKEASEKPQYRPTNNASNIMGQIVWTDETYNINVTGVMHEHNGINPQMIIPKLKEEDEVILEIDENNRYDSTAIKVKTVSGIQIGWVSQKEEIKPLLFSTIKNGNDVIAWVSRKYKLTSYPGKLGLSITVTILPS